MNWVNAGTANPMHMAMIASVINASISVNPRVIPIMVSFPCLKIGIGLSSLAFARSSPIKGPESGLAFKLLELKGFLKVARPMLG
ncbi:hypothetical protein [Pseudomonas sp. BN411]|uniref:hypothetical protein n=1 Tax=Pseudomonas sp. BN411 TaxID=2567887 RepID=UPI0024549537|nr:hypothetical protein [Pseudomonas sp. BN411]